ncbi:MAG: hypothetical protein GY728_07690 [Phycisphaeraceae bacterium]|nr:hypothetical protein [Phycisphaeraceae bacterium]MCP4937723.1 hypothetical protein [Phycisphaeraceae bacterium]
MIIMSIMINMIHLVTTIIPATVLTLMLGLFVGAPAIDPSAESTDPPDSIATAPVLTRSMLESIRLRDVRDVNGGRKAIFPADGPGLVVVVLSSTTCPIANASVPELRRLHAMVDGVGGRLFLVHAMPGITAEAAVAHAGPRRLEMPILLDDRHDLVTPLDGTVVPEAFVMTRAADRWTIRYRGPLDNLYAEIGRRRRNATSAYARDAVTAIVAGGAIAQPIRPAVGCRIDRIGRVPKAVPEVANE